MDVITGYESYETVILPRVIASLVERKFASLVAPLGEDRLPRIGAVNSNNRPFEER